MRRAASSALALLAMVASCSEVEPRRRSSAPLNASADFPCDRYGDTPVKAVPSEGRCVIQGKPTFDYTILVNVPETSQYAAGHTFVLTSADLARTGPPQCVIKDCLALPAVANVNGAYSVTKELAKRQGVELTRTESIPVRAVYVPVGRDDRDTFNPALPLDVIFASSRIVDLDNPTVAYLRSLPAGKWRRAFEPQPPWDELFPPRIDSVQVKRGGDVFDLVEVGGANGGLDDPTGTSRDALVTRAEGLEGWKVWLQDRLTGQRISTVKTLTSRTQETPRLDTTGIGTLLPDTTDAIVAPPEGWIGVPRLVGRLVNGSGLKNLSYPELRAPVALEGIVAAGTDGGVFLAVASRVTFVSESITLPNGKPDERLQYSAPVSTDDRGRFATVLPPGTYRVTVEPLEGTGFASFENVVVIEDKRPITLLPPRRTRVHGMAVLTDGRPLAHAEILATAEPLADTSARATPRPGRTRSGEDGTFALDLDQGAYVFTVIPEDGTGFPRVVTRATIAVDEADLGIVRVPPPTRLEIELRDPTSVAKPISSARIRIFATPDDTTAPAGTATGPGATQPALEPALEIGSGITNSAGRAEILLAQRPK